MSKTLNWTNKSIEVKTLFLLDGSKENAVYIQATGWTSGQNKIFRVIHEEINTGIVRIAVSGVDDILELYGEPIREPLEALL